VLFKLCGFCVSPRASNSRVATHHAGADDIALYVVATPELNLRLAGSGLAFQACGSTHLLRAMPFTFVCVKLAT
jgi:hypothetical protein